MLIQKLADFKIHLSALRSAIDSRESSRLELLKTIDSLTTQLHQSQEASLARKRKKTHKNLTNGEDSDSEELTETEFTPEESDFSGKRSRKISKRFLEADNMGNNNGDYGSDSDINNKSFENIHLLKTDDSAQNLASSSNKSKKRRGKLPENSTTKLKKWIFDHWFHPYPSEEEKVVLCNETGLSLSQLNNWFTNARRRVLPKSKAAGLLPNAPPVLNTDGAAPPVIPPNANWVPPIKRVQQHTYLPQSLVGVTVPTMPELIAITNKVTAGIVPPANNMEHMTSDNNSMVHPEEQQAEVEQPKDILT